MKRLLAVGDIHGCYNTVKSLIEDRIKPTSDDKLIFLGDYVDRGLLVYETIEYMIELQQRFNCVFIKGNHEDMFIRYLKKECRMEEYNMFFVNGGTSTMESYCNHLKDDTGKPRKMANGLDWTDLPKSHRDFYDSLKTYHEEGDFIFAHAGVNPNFKTMKDQQDHDLMWIRSTFLYWPNVVMKGKTIVHGHTPMDRYELLHHNHKFQDRINLDSGCIFGLELTCMDVLTREKYTEKNKDRRVA